MSKTHGIKTSQSREVKLQHFPSLFVMVLSWMKWSSSGALWMAQACVSGPSGRAALCSHFLRRWTLKMAVAGTVWGQRERHVQLWSQKDEPKAHSSFYVSLVLRGIEIQTAAHSSEVAQHNCTPPASLHVDLTGKSPTI
ncbi:hypothetical protein MN608_01169 [Microdochium nivale]|nr:hypothetical protein MN608_01169 [Microdochium nivale]